MHIDGSVKVLLHRIIWSDKNCRDSLVFPRISLAVPAKAFTSSVFQAFD